MTQKEIILEDLKEAGKDGIHSWNFYRRYMPTFSQRIGDLIKDGYKILRINRGNKGCTYILVN